MSEKIMVENEKTCIPCSGDMAVLSPEVVNAQLEKLGEAWQLDASGKILERHFKLKGFAKATYLANLCAWLADKEGHHPDICFGFGYVIVRLTTHEIDGLSENDFIWAANLNALVD
jgi:4a-hydroxytetrahydrobiopterin dehydratase